MRAGRSGHGSGMLTAGLKAMRLAAHRPAKHIRSGAHSAWLVKGKAHARCELPLRSRQVVDVRAVRAATPQRLHASSASA